MKITQICPCPLCSGSAALPSRRQAGIAFDTNALDIHDVTVPVPHLPRHLEGLTIAHLTDTHLRRLGRLEERVRAAVQARDPAVVVLTGDMISARKALPLLAEFCRALTAPGRHVLAIRGNHEVSAQVPVADFRRQRPHRLTFGAVLFISHQC